MSDFQDCGAIECRDKTCLNIRCS